MLLMRELKHLKMIWLALELGMLEFLLAIARKPFHFHHLYLAQIMALAFSLLGLRHPQQQVNTFLPQDKQRADSQSESMIILQQ
jgi:hypothetical protein